MISQTPTVGSLFLALWIFLSFTQSNPSARQNSGSPPGQQQPATSSSQAPASGAAKPVRPKKVYTDDDFRSGDSSGPSAAGEVDISNINNCDKNCRSEVFKGLVTPGGWDSDKGLARALKEIRGDAEWQAALHAFARYRVKFCELETEKERVKVDPAAAERAKGEYSRKVQALADEMRRSVHTRWSDFSWIGNDVDLHLEARFTVYQRGRIMTAPCPVSSGR
jgi:hypothetical protein